MGSDSFGSRFSSQDQGNTKAWRVETLNRCQQFQSPPPLKISSTFHKELCHDVVGIHRVLGQGKAMICVILEASRTLRMLPSFCWKNTSSSTLLATPKSCLNKIYCTSPGSSENFHSVHLGSHWEKIIFYLWHPWQLGTGRAAGKVIITETPPLVTWTFSANSKRSKSLKDVRCGWTVCWLRTFVSQEKEQERERERNRTHDASCRPSLCGNHPDLSTLVQSLPTRWPNAERRVAGFSGYVM